MVIFQQHLKNVEQFPRLVCRAANCRNWFGYLALTLGNVSVFQSCVLQKRIIAVGAHSNDAKYLEISIAPIINRAIELTFISKKISTNDHLGNSGPSSNKKRIYNIR